MRIVFNDRVRSVMRLLHKAVPCGNVTCAGSAPLLEIMNHRSVDTTNFRHGDIDVFMQDTSPRSKRTMITVQQTIENYCRERGHRCEFDTIMFRPCTANNAKHVHSYALGYYVKAILNLTMWFRYPLRSSSPRENFQLIFVHEKTLLKPSAFDKLIVGHFDFNIVRGVYNANTDKVKYPTERRATRPITWYIDRKCFTTRMDRARGKKYEERRRKYIERGFKELGYVRRGKLYPRVDAVKVYH